MEERETQRNNLDREKRIDGEGEELKRLTDKKMIGAETIKCPYFP